MAVAIDPELKAKLLSVLLDGLLTDGAHHKQHELETAVKLLTDCPTITVEAKDYHGKPYSYQVLGESEEFQAFRRSAIHEEDIESYRAEGYTEAEIAEIEVWEGGIPG